MKKRRIPSSASKEIHSWIKTSSFEWLFLSLKPMGSSFQKILRFGGFIWMPKTWKFWIVFWTRSFQAYYMDQNWRFIWIGKCLYWHMSLRPKSANVWVGLCLFKLANVRLQFVYRRMSGWRMSNRRLWLHHFLSDDKSTTAHSRRQQLLFLICKRHLCSSCWI